MKERITKGMFYKMGGFSNSKLYRKMVNGRWQYYKILD